MDLTALGAFLSGAGAVLSGLLAIRSTRRRAEERCRERIEEVMRAFREGADARR